MYLYDGHHLYEIALFVWPDEDPCGHWTPPREVTPTPHRFDGLVTITDGLFPPITAYRVTDAAPYLRAVNRWAQQDPEHRATDVNEEIIEGVNEHELP